MSLPAKQDRFDAQAYLAWETEQTEKHQYIAGEIFAMAGASEAHVTVAGNVFFTLRAHLRGGPCSVFISDMKLRVETDDAFFYPDVFVTCAESDRTETRYKSAPTLTAEVLSPSTSAYDHGAKFAAYRKLPSLREYLLLRQYSLQADFYQRSEDNCWQHWRRTQTDERIPPSCVDIQPSLSEIYVDVPDVAAVKTAQPYKAIQSVQTSTEQDPQTNLLKNVDQQ